MKKKIVTNEGKAPIVDSIFAELEAARVKANSLADTAATPSSSSIRDQLKAQVDVYRKENVIGVNEDVLAWWKARKHTYNLLFLIMRCILCIPATSASSERCFSGAKLVLSDKRNRLGLDKVRHLVFLRNCWDYAEKLK